MEKRNLTCIRCPLGCQITVTLENGEVTEVTGNTCPRGEQYAKKEVTNVSGNTCERGEVYARNEVTAPVRIVTSNVKVNGGDKDIVSVKTAQAIPKGKIFEVLEDIKPVVVKAPVHIGDVIVADAAGTGVDIIASKEVAAL